VRNGRLFFSAVQLAIVVALFGVGGLLLGMHYSSYVRQKVADWILGPQTSFMLLGWLVVAIALLLAVCFGMMQKARYLRLEMGGKEFFAEDALLKQAIEQFWQETFPDAPVPKEIYLAGKKIEIITQDAEYDLEELEQRLASHLSQKFGYQKEFFVTLVAK